MHIEIDQSGKVEITRVPTVLAYANHESYSILIPARTKRQWLQYVRLNYKKPEYHYTRIFSVCLFLLIENNIEKFDSVLIDTEYPGKDGLIKSMLIGYLRKFKLDYSKLRLHFGFVGKRSQVHKVAIETYRGNRKPSKVVTMKDVLRVMGK